MEKKIISGKVYNVNYTATLRRMKTGERITFTGANPESIKRIVRRITTKRFEIDVKKNSVTAKCVQG